MEEGGSLGRRSGERRRVSFPHGQGYGNSEVLCKNPLTREAVKRALCLTLGKEVILKKSKCVHMLAMNSAFGEALAQARCAHPNVCDFLDFRLYFVKSGHPNSYIVMESLRQTLPMEMQERRFRPCDEVELTAILQEAVAALLNAKRQDLPHQDIKPHNILRGPQGLNLAAFGAAWLKGLHSSAIGTEMYISPEAWEAKVQQRSFESDVFSLRMTMLHVAAMKLPGRTPAMSRATVHAAVESSDIDIQ